MCIFVYVCVFVYICLCLCLCVCILQDNAYAILSNIIIIIVMYYTLLYLYSCILMLPPHLLFSDSIVQPPSYNTLMSSAVFMKHYMVHTIYNIIINMYIIIMSPSLQKGMLFNCLLSHHCVQEVNEIWYTGRATNNLGYHILLTFYTKWPNSEQLKGTCLIIVRKGPFCKFSDLTCMCIQHVRYSTIVLFWYDNNDHF